MKTRTSHTQISGPLRRRDLIAIFAYVNRCGAGSRSVDGTFGRPETHLDRLAAAARMQ
jgi:hypothetical protein